MDTLVNRVIELAALQPDKTAVAFKKETLTYRQLLDRAIGLADRLREAGVRPGDRVCFTALSKPQMPAVYLAVHMAGGVAVFLDKNGTPQNMAAIYDEAEAVLMLTDKPMKEYAQGRNVMPLRRMYEEAAPKPQTTDDAYRIFPEEEALAEILFTTGTTGRPKGVMLSYRAVYSILTHTIQGNGMRQDDIVLLPLPLNHSLALRVMRAALYNGETVILQNGFTFGKEVENNIRLYHCNAMAAVPASYEIIRSQMQDAFSGILGQMRYIEFGAGSLSTGQRREITSLLPGVKITNTWGSSETGGALFCPVDEVVKDERKIGILGRPLPDVEVRALDAQGNPVSTDPDHPGRLALRGDMLMSGYWKMPQKTEEALQGGWLLTNDLIYQDADGDIFMLGRSDDIINVGGEKVSPIEVENTASEYPYISDCVCVKADDPNHVLDQVPALMVKIRSGYDKDDFIRFMSARMEHFKMPQEIRTVDEVPRNRMQKIDRRAAQTLWDRSDTADLMNPVIATILARKSIRKFTEQPIERNILELLVKAGRQAPTGHNMQTWRFTVLTDLQKITGLHDAAQTAAKEQKVHFYGWENPQAMILVSNDRRNQDGCQDASCAAENIMLAANSLGLGCVWLNPLMTLRDTEPVKSVLDAFEIPKTHTVWAAIALGYPAADAVSPARKENVVKWL